LVPQFSISEPDDKTAQFYLNHGAQRIICVEGSEEALELLAKNFGHDDRVAIIPAMIDSIKIDIEGNEENLVLERHFPARFELLEKLDENVTLWKLQRSEPSQINHIAWRVRAKLREMFHKIRVNSAHGARLMINCQTLLRREPLRIIILSFVSWPPTRYATSYQASRIIVGQDQSIP
jgi:hypothetical protein